MKNNKKNFCLVARMQGNRLMLNRETSEELATLYDRRVEGLYRKEPNADRRAQLASTELERKGDFLWDCGAKAAAVKAYVEAERVALDGAYYDHRRMQHPAAALRERARMLREKVAACAASDPRLAELLRTLRG